MDGLSAWAGRGWFECVTEVSRARLLPGAGGVQLDRRCLSTGDGRTACSGVKPAGRTGPEPTPPVQLYRYPPPPAPHGGNSGDRTDWSVWWSHRHTTRNRGHHLETSDTRCHVQDPQSLSAARAIPPINTRHPGIRTRTAPMPGDRPRPVPRPARPGRPPTPHIQQKNRFSVEMAGAPPQPRPGGGRSCRGRSGVGRVQVCLVGPR